MALNGALILESSAATADNTKSAVTGDVKTSMTEEEAQLFEKENAIPLEDENITREDSVTAMDEDANVIEIEESEGVVENETALPRLKAKSRATTTSSSTVYVVNFNTKGNATTSYTEADTGISGYTNGAYGADAAYLGTSGNKVKFMLAGVVGLVDKSEVQVIKRSEAKVVSGYYVSGGRLIHGIVCDMTTPGYRTTLDNGEAPSYLKTGVTYYSYDGHYFYSDYATMLSDYGGGVRTHSVNPNDPYYNYYQYLPLRSTTSYSSNTLNSMINTKSGSGSKMRNTGSTFVSNQNKYGVNALLMAGVAANESAWGNSSIAKSNNNLFGLNAVDSSPGTSAYTYGSVSSCIADFANGWMSRGYLNPDDWRYFGGFLGNKGSGLNVKYASDPYWGEKAANVAYYLDNLQGGKDYDRYTIGIKDTINSEHTVVNVRNGSSTSTKILYDTGMASNYAVLVLNDKATNSFYKIQSDGVLNGSRTALSSSGSYDFDDMYANISSDYVDIVNNGSYEEEEKAPATLSSISITTPPTKTVYTEGEKFDASGMKVTAKMSDGTTKDVTAGVTYSDQALKTTDKSITVSYTSGNVTKTATQAITVKARPVVDSVSINPSVVTVEKGDSLTFGVAVTGQNDPPTTVIWTVSGAKSDGTGINDSGRLTVGEDESAEQLTVTAASTYDDTKMAIATVKVAEMQEAGESQGSDSAGDGSGEAGAGEESEGEELTEVDPVTDEETGIEVSAVIAGGAESIGDITLAVDHIDENSEKYDYEMLTEPVSDMEILGVFDVSLSETLEGSIALTFDIGSEHAGKTVKVLHYAHAQQTDESVPETEAMGAAESDEAAGTSAEESDATDSNLLFREEYPATADDNGNVTVELTSLSPIVIAVEKEANTDGDSAGSTTDDTGVTGGNASSGNDAVTGSGNASVNNDAVAGGSHDAGNNDAVTGDTSENDASGSDAVSAAKDNAGAETSEADDDVATGDSFMAGLWMMLATAAALGAVAVIFTRDRRAGSRR